MTTIYAIENELKSQNIDFSSLELLEHIRQKYKAYCPKCGAVLSFSDISNPDYLGACLECDEDFYAIECYLELEGV